jgi:hypothetical protein
MILKASIPPPHNESTDSVPQSPLWRWLGYAKKTAFVSFAIIGFFWVGTLVSCTIVRPAFYVDEAFPPITAPGGKLFAYRSVTTGGLGTVWTTKIFIGEVPKGEEFLIYRAQDSDYVPKFRWRDEETLLVELSCDRVNHLSNPSDWDEGSTPMQRVAVRFTYPQSCSPTMAMPNK